MYCINRNPIRAITLEFGIYTFTHTHIHTYKLGYTLCPFSLFYIYADRLQDNGFSMYEDIPDKNALLQASALVIFHCAAVFCGGVS